MNSFRKANLFNSIPPVTSNILIINVLVCLACYVYKPLVLYLALFPVQSGYFNVYQLVTFMFTQVDIGHLFFNMFAVFMFGKVLENYWGSKKFLLYYMICGIGSGLVQLLVCYIQILNVRHGLSADLIQEVYTNGANLLANKMNYSDAAMSKLNLLLNTPTIGASGAVFGILLAFGMLFPNVPLYLMFLPIPIKAKYFVIGYGLIELYLGFANRVGDNVAHFAHLGGMLFGIIMILYWKGKNKRKYRKTNSGFRNYNNRNTDYDYNAQKNEEHAEIDRILEKIKKSGYNCLTDEEKKKLFDASNK